MEVFLNIKEPYYATEEDLDTLSEANDHTVSIVVREQDGNLFYAHEFVENKKGDGSDETSRPESQSGADSKESLLSTGKVVRAALSVNSLSKMLSQSAVKKFVTPEIHALAVSNLDMLFNDAIQGYKGKDANKNPNIASMHRYFTPMPIGEDVYVVKITVKEFSQKQEGSRLYSVESLKVVKPAGNWVASISENRRNYTPQAGFKKKLLKKIISVNPDSINCRRRFKSGKERRNKSELSFQKEEIGYKDFRKGAYGTKGRNKSLIAGPCKSRLGGTESYSKLLNIRFLQIFHF